MGAYCFDYGGCHGWRLCQSDRISLTAGPSQQAIVRDGVPALVSNKQNTVMLRPL